MIVHFIGAGPGAADLITLRGLKLIQTCPVCLYAGSLVPKEIVSAAPSGARVIDTSSMTLEDIVEEFRDADRKDRDVARVREREVHEVRREVGDVGLDEVRCAADLARPLESALPLVDPALERHPVEDDIRPGGIRARRQEPRAGGDERHRRWRRAGCGRRARSGPARRPTAGRPPRGV